LFFIFFSFELIRCSAAIFYTFHLPSSVFLTYLNKKASALDHFQISPSFLDLLLSALSREFYTASYFFLYHKKALLSIIKGSNSKEATGDFPG
jgi:hypothetical protein